MGSTRLSIGGKIYDVETHFSHPDWQSPFTPNDIALIKVTRDIEFNEFVQPIPISTRNIGGDVKAIASGWGTTSFQGSTPDKLQFLEVLTVTNKQCQERLETPIEDSAICAFAKNGEGMCHGDSG